MTKTSESVDLTTGGIWEKMFLFALPILCTNLFQQFYNIADAAMVGIFVNSNALAAVGSTGALTNLLIGFFVGLSTGAGVVVARYFGAKDDRGVGESVHTAVAVAIISGALLTVAGYFLIPGMLRLMKTPDGEVFEMSVTYLRIVFFGMIPTMLYNVCAGILRAVGDSRRPLIYLIISGVSNMILNAIFIIPLQMGVLGAGLATVISQLLSVALIVTKLMRSRESFRLVPAKIRIHKLVLFQVLRIGIPSGIQSMMYSVSNLLIQSNINSFGENAMAGCAACGKLDGFVYMPINAFGLAATTFTGQNVGAGRVDRVKKGTLAAITLGSSITATLGVLVLFIVEPVMEILTKGNMEAVQYGVMMAQVLALTYVVFVPAEVLSGVIRGAGSAISATIITAITICVLRVSIVVFAMPVFNDIRLVFFSYPISWSVSSLTFFIYYLSGRWLRRADIGKSLS